MAWRRCQCAARGDCTARLLLVIGGDGAEGLRWCGRYVTPLEQQRKGLKILEDGAQGPDVVNTEDEVEVAQLNAETRNGELIANAERNVASHALASQMVPIMTVTRKLALSTVTNLILHMVPIWRKLWVEPMSRRASRQCPLTSTCSSIVFVVQISARAWRETTSMAVGAQQRLAQCPHGCPPPRPPHHPGSWGT